MKLGTRSVQPINLLIWIMYGIFFFTGASIGFGQGKSDELVVARLQYIYKVRQKLGNSAWNSFGGQQYDLPLIHFDGETTFISNPSVKFLEQFRPKPFSEKSGTRIFKLDYRIDSTPFHMKVSMSTGEDTAEYDHYAPFIKCSSREEFERVKGESINTQKWSALVIHEFFHAFQLSHKQYFQHNLQNDALNEGGAKSLNQLYSSHKWFKDSVDQENALLLQAIRTPRRTKTYALIEEFLKVRKERRAHISTADFDFGRLERSFETLEGTARYIEAFVLLNPIKDRNLALIDSRFANSRELASEDLEYLYDTNVSGSYFYATGYNILRLLKKMKVDYEALLFKQPSVTLEDILKQQPCNDLCKRE